MYKRLQTKTITRGSLILRFGAKLVLRLVKLADHKESNFSVNWKGLIGIETPAEVGGHGGDFLTHITTCEEQVYASVPGNFLIQSDMVLPYLSKYGTPEQQEHFIPKMIAGEIIGAIVRVFL